MTHSDFYIGLEFVSTAGFIWKCTDLGTRTVIAIQVTPGYDETWQVGPPYALQEIVFDEEDLKSCYLAEIDLLKDRAESNKAPGHPGFSVDEVFNMIRSNKSKYPRANILRFDRVYNQSIIHGYSARVEDLSSSGGTVSWTVLALDLKSKKYLELSEKEFNALDKASPTDFIKVFSPSV